MTFTEKLIELVGTEKATAIKKLILEEGLVNEKDISKSGTALLACEDIEFNRCRTESIKRMELE